MVGVPRMLIPFLQSEAYSQGPSNVSPGRCVRSEPQCSHTHHSGRHSRVLCAVSSRRGVTWRKRGSSCCAQGCMEPPHRPRAFLYFIHGNSQVEWTPGMIPSFYFIFWAQELLTTPLRMNDYGQPGMESTDPGSQDKGGGCHRGEKPPPYPLTSRYAIESIVVFALNIQLYFK